MTPMEAIVANTSGNAWLMGLEGELGAIGSGKLADITVSQRPNEISAVIKDGRIVDRDGGGFRQLSEEVPRARMFFSG